MFRRPNATLTLTLGVKRPTFVVVIVDLGTSPSLTGPDKLFFFLEFIQMDNSQSRAKCEGHINSFFFFWRDSKFCKREFPGFQEHNKQRTSDKPSVMNSFFCFSLAVGGR